MENLQLKEVSGVTDEHVKTVQQLLNQLTSSPISFTKESCKLLSITKIVTCISSKKENKYTG